LADIYEKEEMDKTEIEKLKEIIIKTEAIKADLTDSIKKADAKNIKLKFNEDLVLADEIIIEAQNTLENDASVVDLYRKNDTIPDELNRLKSELSKIKDDLNKQMLEHKST
jgi:hypothetical protein